MHKIFVFGLILSLVIQPVALSTTTFAAENLDGDFSNVEAEEDSSLTEENEILEETLIDEKLPNELEELYEEPNEGNDIAITNPESVSDEVRLPEEQIYISKVYSEDSEEFVEIYNSGDDLIVNNLDILFNGSDVVNLGRGVFKSKKSILIRYVKQSVADGKYDGYYTNKNLIGANFDIIMRLNDYSQRLCFTGFEGCDSKINANLKYIVQTCLEHEGFVGICETNKYSRVDKTSENMKTHYGGFIPYYDDDSGPDDNEEGPNPYPESPQNTCENLKLNEIAANVDEQFIEIVNVGENPADLNGCMIKTDTVNDKAHIFKDDIELDPGEFYVINLSESNLSIVKTSKRTVYLLSEDGENEVDSIFYSNLKKDTSWSRFSGTNPEEDIWRQTYNLTPGEENMYAEFPDCEVGLERNLETGRCRKVVDAQTAVLTECAEGQYRSVETNRCRKIQEETTTLTPCRADQYRHPETNRCRKIESIGATLTPCKADQYRHPETNRCRKIPTEATPTPCKDGYERNLETNRCRKIVKNTGATDKLDDSNQDDKKQFTGWLAIAGVLVLATGVIVWEWKREIANFFSGARRKVFKVKYKRR